MKEIATLYDELFAILSHTWVEEEVTFQNLTQSTITMPDGFNEDEPWLNDSTPAISRPAASLKGFKKLMDFYNKDR